MSRTPLSPAVARKTQKDPLAGGSFVAPSRNGIWHGYRMHKTIPELPIRVNRFHLAHQPPGEVVRFEVPNRTLKTLSRSAVFCCSDLHRAGRRECSRWPLLGTSRQGGQLIVGQVGTCAA